MNSALTIMVGLPQSGKTTYAKELQLGGWVRVCPDEIRLAMHGQNFHGPAEPFVWATAELAARSLLLGGHNVVIDATNTTRERRKQWVRVAKDMEIEPTALILDTPAEACLRRNERTQAVPPEVIERMASQWEPVDEKGLRPVTKSY